MMLKDGVDIEKDFTEVANYFKLSGDQGNIEARFQYGTLLKNGFGVPKNEEEAESYLRIETNDESERFLSSRNRGKGMPDSISSVFISETDNWTSLNMKKILREAGLGIKKKRMLLSTLKK